MASRLAQAAEFVEVANRVGGVEAARELARERRGAQFDPAVSDLIEAEGDVILSDIDAVGHLGRGDRRGAGAGDRGVRRALRRRPARHRELRRPEVALLPRPCAWRSPSSPVRPAAGSGSPSRSCGRSAAPALVHDLGRLGVSNAMLDKRGPLGAGEWERAPPPAVPDRAHAPPVRGARAARGDRRPAPRAARRLRLPARPVGRRHLPARAHPRRRRRLPGDARAAPSPPGALRRGGRGRAARRGQGRAASTATPWRRCSAPPATASRGAARARRASRSARSRSSGCSRAGSRTRRSPSGS